MAISPAVAWQFQRWPEGKDEITITTTGHRLPEHAMLCSLGCVVKHSILGQKPGTVIVSGYEGSSRGKAWTIRMRLRRKLTGWNLKYLSSEQKVIEAALHGSTDASQLSKSLGA